jgi:oligopeptide transport system substrate-binding protein
MFSQKRMAMAFGVLVIASMLAAACTPAATGTPQVVRETQVVTQIVAGTPQTVVITATPGPVEPTTAAPAGATVLRINLGTYPDIIDPQKSSFVNEIAHLNLIYEGLTRLDDKLETVPGAAESWEYNEDATQLTFTLREGLKYSDGSLLNAKRFEYSILRNIDPATAGEYAQITDNIQGAAAWRTADTSTATEEDLANLKAAVKVQAQDMSGNACTDYEQADCRKLVIGVDGNPSTPEADPAPFFHTVMALWVTYPAKEELISEGGENWWTGSVYQIGNGPFVLQALEPFVRGYFTPNANYWRGVPTYDLEYRYITDTAVSFEAYKNNEFDIVGIAAEDLATIQADATLNAEAQIYPGSCTFAVMFHQQKEPFTDPKVRQAFTQALDREAWVKDVIKGLGAPTLTWIPPGFPGYDANESRWGYDPDAAKKALSESTYGSVDKLPPITATFGDTPRNRTRWEWLVAKWKEVLGVDIALNPVEPTTFTALTKDISTAPQMFILGWCADYPDPQNWLSVYWHTGAFGERIGYSNADLDKMMEEADATTDPAKRMDLYAQAQTLLTDGVPVAFMYNNVNAYLVKPWVTGYAKTPMDAGFIGAQDVLSIQIDAAAQKAGGG